MAPINKLPTFIFAIIVGSILLVCFNEVQEVKASGVKVVEASGAKVVGASANSPKLAELRSAVAVKAAKSAVGLKSVKSVKSVKAVKALGFAPESGNGGGGGGGGGESSPPQEPPQSESPSDPPPPLSNNEEQPQPDAEAQSQPSGPPPPPPNVCGFPNGTLSRLHIFNCDGGHLPLQFSSAHIVDTAINQPVYPIGPLASYKHLVAIIVNLWNHGEEIQSDEVFVTAYNWGPNSVGTCTWNPIPDPGGILAGINGCQSYHDCPLPVGKSQVTVPLNPPNLAPILHELITGHAYQLVVRVIDTSNGPLRGKEVGCLVTQGLIELK